MKRLLCIVSAMNPCGAETFLMKIYRCLDRNYYQMDFCVNHTVNFYAKEIEKMGGKIYQVPLKSKHPLACFNTIKRIVYENNYNYVIRINEHSLSTLDLIAAKAGGAKNLIMRSSNASSGTYTRIFLHNAFRFLTKYVPTVKLAPSTEAAEYSFGRGCVKAGEVFLLHNGLHIKNFTFSDSIRQKIRKQLELQNELVIGHIGRFSEQKNHNFLFEIFSEILKLRSDAILILIGTGELEAQMKMKTEEMNLSKYVKFLGVRSDVSELLNAMDCFVFPSYYEGMPNTVIEAQTNGLPCLISDAITKEAKVTEYVHMLSLRDTAAEWAKKAIEITSNSKDKREKAAYKMQQRGYEITDCTKQFVKKIFEET